MDKTQDSIEPKVQLWGDRFSLAESNQQKLFKQAAKWYDLMNAVVNDKDFAPWRSKIFIPFLASKAWTLIPKLVQGQPKLVTSAKDPDVAKNTEMMLEHDWNNPERDEPMFKKLTDPLIDAIVVGKGFAKVPWTVKNKEIFEQLTKESSSVDEAGNPITTRELVLGKEKVTTKTIGFNNLVPVNIFDVFVSPSGYTLQDKPWVIIRTFETESSLKDRNDAKGGKFYQNLDKLSDLGASADSSAKYNRSRNRLLTQTDQVTADKTIKNIEIWECYDKETGKIVTIAGRSVIIRDQKNTYWHGRYPLVDFEIKPNAFSFWGQSIFQLGERAQAALNDTINHFMDNWNLAIEGMLIAEEGTELDDFTVEPGGVVKFTGQMPPQQFKFPNPDAGSLQMLQQIFRQSVEDVTVSSYASGTPNSAVDKTAGTGIGIQALQEAASDIISFMKQYFRLSIWEILDQWKENNKQFITAPVDVTVTQDGRRSKETIDPAYLQGNVNLELDDASMQPISKEVERENFTVYMKGLFDIADRAMAAQKPINIEYDDLAKEFSDKYGMNYEKFITDVAQGMPGAPETQDGVPGMPGGMPPGMPPMGAVPPQGAPIPQMGPQGAPQMPQGMPMPDMQGQPQGNPMDGMPMPDMNPNQINPADLPAPDTNPNDKQGILQRLMGMFRR